MKSTCLRPLFAILTLTLGLAAVRAADLPYAGTWKITLPDQKFDATPWLVKIDKEAKAVTLVSGFDQYAKTKVSDVKADGKAVTFTLTVTLPVGPRKFQVHALPPGEKDKDQMLGSIQINDKILPVWMHRTTLAELTKATAVRESPGFTQLDEAIKLTDLDEKRKKVEAIITAHPGQPIHFLALQAILGDQVRQKAKPEAFRETVERYRKLAGQHGELFLAQANLDLARNLMGHKPSEAVGIESAREAVKLLGPDHNSGLRMTAYLTLAAGLRAAGKEDEAKPVADQIAKLADELIKTAKTEEEALAATFNLAGILLSSPAGPVADKGLELAQRAVKLTKSDAPPAQRAGVYNLLAAALKSRGKADEAKKLEPTLAKIEDDLDAAYDKEMRTFKIDKVEKREGDRVVLVELFTNAPNRQVVAATIAFDAARQTYAPKDVVFLQYHVMFPDGDSLVCPDSEVRKAFYTADLEGLPAVFVDGKLTAPLGGARQRGKNSYDIVREAIGKALPAEPGAKVALTVTRAGDTVTAKATTSDLKETGSKVRLRFALVEDRVRYPGNSGVRIHHHVVRGFLGGATGFRLDKKEGTQSASINLQQLRKSLSDYIDGLAKKAGVPSPIKPLELEKLKVIAWVQDEDSKAVLGAAQADVPAK